VDELILAMLAASVEEGTIVWSNHYLMRIFERNVPDRRQVRYLLGDDEPEIIERGKRSCLVWSIMDSGRCAHLVCSWPPNPVMITAYWPDTEPSRWVDNYKRRA